MKGKVQTVLGEINPSELGLVLTHEHFENKIEPVFFTKPLDRPELKECEFTVKNLGWIRQFPYSHIPNMDVTGPEVRNALVEDIKRFKSCGGGTIVDNTTIGPRLPDHPTLTKKLSQNTGVHIVAGTGFYVAGSQPESNLALSEEAMVSLMTKHITEGCDADSTVKSGIIGEVGCSWPLKDFERRSLRATGEAESALGCPVMIHPGRSPAAPEEIVRIYTEAGGNPRRFVMAHLDRTFLDKEALLEFASVGSFLEYDLFGIETSYYQQCEEVFMPSDGQRIQMIQALLKEGYEDRVLISHDIHTKHRMEHFGGHGFGHILTVVIPMMLKSGISQEIIDRITIHNPASWLTFAK